MTYKLLLAKNHFTSSNNSDNGPIWAFVIIKKDIELCSYDELSESLRNVNKAELQIDICKSSKGSWQGKLEIRNEFIVLSYFRTISSMILKMP